MNNLFQIYRRIVKYVNSFPKYNPYLQENNQSENYFEQNAISNNNIKYNYPTVNNYQQAISPTKQRINNINKEYFETIKKILFKEI